MTQQAIKELPSECLKESIRLLLEIGHSMGEYELICNLNEQGWALSMDSNELGTLFKTHFLVYHALYELQVEYWEQQQRLLDISALMIGFVDPKPLSSSSDNERVSVELPAVNYETHQELRNYYLDLSHLEQATEASIHDLLNQFWSRFVASDDKAEALAILDLPIDTDLKALKQRYRALAMEHHPDRGGEVERFQRINWAFGVLQKALVGHCEQANHSR